MEYAPAPMMRNGIAQAIIKFLVSIFLFPFGLLILLWRPSTPVTIKELNRSCNPSPFLSKHGYGERR